MAGITHAFVSAKSDGADTTLVRPSDWNAMHIGPTGRGTNYLVAGATAPDVVKNQADYVCDGTADQTEINLALAAARTATDGIQKVTLIGEFTTSASINATGFSAVDSSFNFRALTLDLSAAQIHASAFTSAVPIIDMSGSSYVRVYGGRIDEGSYTSPPSTVPSCGIFLARIDGYQSCCLNVFFGTVVWGWFTKAAIYSYGSEGNKYYACTIVNQTNAAHGFSFNATNPGGLTSPFVTIVTGQQSNTMLVFFGCDIAACGTGAAYALYVEGAANSIENIALYETMIYGLGTAALCLDTTNADVDGVVLSGLRVSDLFPTYAIYAPGTHAVNYLSMTGCTLWAVTKEIYVVGTANKWIVDRTNNFFLNLGCTFGAITNSIIEHPSYSTHNSGSSTGTGAQQTIAHGLGFAPTCQHISLTGGSATALPYHSAAPDATYIYVTAANGQAWFWATVGY